METIVMIAITAIVLVWYSKSEKSNLAKEEEKKYTSKIPTKKTYDNSLRIYLAGTHIKSRKNYILKNGWDTMPVDLEAEPNNKHDKNAIAVKNYDKLIGYIPSDKTHLIHPILLNNDYEARFDSMDEEESYSNSGEIHLTVYLRINYN